MPVGEFIAELLLKDLVGTVLCGIGYGTGMVVLKLLTFGKLRIAPLNTLHERKPKSRWWQDWGPWFHQSKHPKVLKADYACLARLLVWLAAIGLIVTYVT